MVGAPQGRVAPRFVGGQPIIGETRLHVVAGRGKGDVDAPAQVGRHLDAVAAAARDDLDLAHVMEDAAGRGGNQGARQVARRHRREGEAAGRRRQAGGIGHRRHLDGRLGAVEERVEHLGVEAAGAGALGRDPVVAPDGVGRRGGELRHVQRPLAGRRHLEAAGARPVDELADERRLVPVGQGIDDPRFLGAARQERPGQGVGLDVDHDHVASLAAAGEHVADAGRRVAGGVDHHVQARRRDQGAGVVADVGGAALQGGGERRGGALFPGPAGLGEGAPGPPHIEIGDGQHVQSRRGARLGQEHGAELAGADETGPDRASRLGAFGQHAVQVHDAFPMVSAAL